MILLGTGTSVGVPVIGCGCDVCRSTNPKNNRTRCSAILGLPGGNLLIDTAPDVRQQLLREGIGIVHAVLYTHEHADHIFGLDDLRLMQFYLGGPVPLYCEATVEQRIRKSFDYAFSSPANLHPRRRAAAGSFTRLRLEPFEMLGARVTPIRMQHGPRFDVLGFRFGNVAYCTDVECDSAREHGAAHGPRLLSARRTAPQGPRHALRSRRGDRKSPASSRRGKPTSRTCRTNWNTKRRTPACRREWRSPTTGCASRSHNKKSRRCDRRLLCLVRAA